MSISRPILTLAACAVLSILAGPLLARAETAPAAPTAAVAEVGAVPQPIWLTPQSPSQNGTCRTFCENLSGFTLVNWSTTFTQCCSGTVNPCPPGTTPGTSSFLPTSGAARLCPPNN
jgi:hypothetical protein